MISKIRVLDEHTINKIAAGEVIENPSSVVKELVENSLDAGATDICIEIQGGGRQMIRISDNGCGMNADDAILCLERHATSKIRQVEELFDLATMGFRGEAIPSIASISKFTLLTCPNSDSINSNEMGTMVIVDGGKILSCCPAARGPGTTIEVKSLFFNVPVRKKFLKSPSYDANEILKTVSLMALGNPEIKFQLLSEGKSLLSTPSNPAIIFTEQLKIRIGVILGQDFVQHIDFIESKNDSVSIQGYAGIPSYTRHNRTGQYLFINRRSVVSPFISYSIKDGYGTSIPTGRFPVFVLHLTLPGELVDVNVHPQKKEVRLRNEKLIKELIFKALECSSQKQSSSYPFSSPPFPSISPVFANAFKNPPSERKEETWNFPPRSFSDSSVKPEGRIIENAKNLASSQYPLPPQKEFNPEVSMQSDKVMQDLELESPSIDYSNLPPSAAISRFNYADILIPSVPKDFIRSPPVLGTIPRYILIDGVLASEFPFSREGLLFVDQKAAHARIIFENLLQNERGKAVAQQTLLIRHPVEVSPFEAETLRIALPQLNHIGIQIQEFGSNIFVIDAIPKFFGNINLQTLMRDIITHLSESNEQFFFAERMKKIATAASHSAVSHSHKLSLEEAQAMIDQLVNCKQPFQCPFGKPIVVHLSSENILKLFLK